MLQNILQDLHYGARMLLKQPGFTLIAVLTLALGIGANTAVFSVVYSLLLKDLPYPQSDRLVYVWSQGKEGRKLLSPPDFVEFAEQTTTLQEVAAISGSGAMVNFTADGKPEQIRARDVTPNFMSVYGVSPALGRTFQPDDDDVIQFNADPNLTPPTSVVMISHEYWQARFGGDPKVIGKLVEIEFYPYQIIGVAPPDFEIQLPGMSDYSRTTQVWALRRMDLRRMPRDSSFMRVVGRLKPGVTMAQAQAEAASFAQRQQQNHTMHRENGFALEVVSLKAELLKGFHTPVLILFGAIGVVLLIACANLANLTLARTAARQHEFAIRLALGSSRARLMRQLLTEGLLYSLAGATVGLLLAVWLIGVLPAFAPRALPRLTEIKLSSVALLFTLGASVLTTVLFGLLPALRFSSPLMASALKEAGRGAIGSGRRRWDNLLVVAEVALSVVLVIGAGLLLQSFKALLEVKPGFRAEQVLTTEMYLPLRRYPRYPSSQSRVRFTQQVSERIAQLPGVESAGLALVVPLSSQDTGHSYATEETAQRLQTYPSAKYRPITPGYFKAAGTSLIAGRDFTWEELQQERLVSIVDAKLADQAWPGQNPLGKRLRLEVWSMRGGPIHLEPIWTEVVGVAENVRSASLVQEDRDTVYLPYGLYAVSELSLLVRTTSDPAALVEPVRREIQQVDSQLATFNYRLMEDFVADAVAPQRFSLSLIGIFGLAGLLLAVIGLYGVMSWSVSRRAQEIGIRIALGARSRDVLRLVLRYGMKLVAVGLALGVAGALGMTQLLKSQLYQVSPTDGKTFIGVTVLMFLVSLVACYLPARRATKVDPIVALRAE